MHQVLDRGVSGERNVSHPRRAQEARTPPISGRAQPAISIFTNGDFCTVEQSDLRIFFARRSTLQAQQRRITAERIAQLEDSHATARAARRLRREMRAWDRIGGRQVRVRMLKPTTKSGRRQPTIAVTKLTKTVVPLPRYVRAIVDRNNHRGIFLDISYDSAKTQKNGVARRRLYYQFELDHAALISGEPIFHSNMGGDIEEVLVCGDMLEAVNRSARKNAKIGINAILQCPAELDRAGRQSFLRRLAQEFDAMGIAYCMTLHLPDALGDQRNHHVHIWFTLRSLERVAPYEWEVGEQLRTDLDGPAAMFALRRTCAQIATETCHAAGHSVRFTHRSNAARGLVHRPQKKLGPKKALRARCGEVVADNEANRSVIASNEKLADEIERADVLRAIRSVPRPQPFTDPVFKLPLPDITPIKLSTPPVSLHPKGPLGEAVNIAPPTWVPQARKINVINAHRIEVAPVRQFPAPQFHQMPTIAPQARPIAPARVLPSPVKPAFPVVNSVTSGFPTPRSTIMKIPDTSPIGLILPKPRPLVPGGPPVCLSENRRPATCPVTRIIPLIGVTSTRRPIIRVYLDRPTVPVAKPVSVAPITELSYRGVNATSGIEIVPEVNPSVRLVTAAIEVELGAEERVRATNASAYSDSLLAKMAKFGASATVTSQVTPRLDNSSQQPISAAEAAPNIATTVKAVSGMNMTSQQMPRAIRGSLPLESRPVREARPAIELVVQPASIVGFTAKNRELMKEFWLGVFSLADSMNRIWSDKPRGTEERDLAKHHERNKLRIPNEDTPPALKVLGRLAALYEIRREELKRRWEQRQHKAMAQQTAGKVVTQEDRRRFPQLSKPSPVSAAPCIPAAIDTNADPFEEAARSGNALITEWVEAFRHGDNERTRAAAQKIRNDPDASRAAAKLDPVVMKAIRLYAPRHISPPVQGIEWDPDISRLLRPD